MATQPSISSSESPDSSPLSTISLDGGRQLAYATYGDPDGTPVVFLHGTPGSRRLGGVLASAAEAHGIRLLAPDRPGYGDSDAWPDRTMSDAGKFVTAVLDDVGVESAGLVAFSGGGPHALATAATHPDRVTRVDIVGGATPPEVTGQYPPVQRVLVGLASTTPTLLGGLLRGQSMLAKRLAPAFVIAQYTGENGAEGIPDAVAAVVKDDFLTAFAHTAAGAVTELSLTAAEWGIDLANVDADTCLWHGDSDTNVPLADARRLCARLPNAEIRVLPDADHLRSLLRSADDVLERHG
ncbi:alpha/beta fold hydrolase [Halobellus marinus]|uniref:alpha/beta fold hydrolase n=1 Tax=Halobellus TaxID=1073986 RepID=UPI0028ACE295|nr:alpha/beta hydrolase [Halobellus sp. DFY28]